MWNLARVTIKSRAEPSRAEPSRAEPSRAEPSRAEPSRAEPSRAEPSYSCARTPAAADAVGRASLDRLGTGSSTGSGQAPARLRERHRRLSAGRRTAVPARPSPSPPPSRFRPARLARAWRAGACALAGALALSLLLGAGAAQAHDDRACGSCASSACHSVASQPYAPRAPTGVRRIDRRIGEITIYWEPATAGAFAHQWTVRSREAGEGNYSGRSYPNPNKLQPHPHGRLDPDKSIRRPC